MFKYKDACHCQKTDKNNQNTLKNPKHVTEGVFKGSMQSHTFQATTASLWVLL